jgi:Trk K+ transport system NAD-binding subunit
MATRSTDIARTMELDDILDYPVIATDIIYEGSAVGENGSGYARPLVAADPFLGFALRKADNAAGAAGAILVRVRTRGRIKLPISNVAITANDRVAVYASDDDTFTLTAGSNSLIGYVSRWIETGWAIVEFDTALVKAALHA